TATVVTFEGGGTVTAGTTNVPFASTATVALNGGTFALPSLGVNNNVNSGAVTLGGGGYISLQGSAGAATQYTPTAITRGVNNQGTLVINAVNGSLGTNELLVTPTLFGTTAATQLSTSTALSLINNNGIVAPSILTTSGNSPVA